MMTNYEARMTLPVACKKELEKFLKTCNYGSDLNFFEGYNMKDGNIVLKWSGVTKGFNELFANDGMEIFNRKRNSKKLIKMLEGETLDVRYCIHDETDIVKYLGEMTVSGGIGKMNVKREKMDFNELLDWIIE